MKINRSIWVSGLSLCVCAAVTTAAFVGVTPRQQARPAAPSGTVFVAGGSYQPLYADASDPAPQRVQPFFLDRYPVTNADYLEFVQANTEWRRSKVVSIFADAGYLKHWRDDVDFGPDSLADSPVVNVSWFAARAYAEWKGMRLPTTAEWEVAAMAGETRPEAQADAAYRQRLLAWYSRPTPEANPPVGSTACNYWGVCDLHGLVWEWVDDFNSALVTGESRNNGDLDLTLFCGSGVIGASNFEDYAAFLRFGFRSGLEGHYTVSSLGFRCAVDAPNHIG